MPAKAPMYLKTSDGKHATATKGSKKLREILSTDMISPPLGDLRHISHVGRGGPDDNFGDTSFLQKANNTLYGTGSKKGDGGVSNGSGAVRGGKKGSKKGRSSSVSHEQTSTLDRFKKKKHPAKFCIPNGDKNSPSSPPILQSAFSLPALSNDNTSPSHNSSSEETKDQSPSTNNNTIAKNKIFSKSEEGLDTSPSPEETPVRTTSNGANGGPPKPRRIISIKSASSPQENSQVESANVMKSDKLSPLRRSSGVLSEMPDSLRTSGGKEEEDDGWSLDLDLGPSLMDEIMGIMDKSKITS